MVRLRPLRLDDEEPFRAADRELVAEGFDFGLGLRDDADWGGYVRATYDRARGINLPHGWVPEHFLVAEVGGVLVGRVSIRLTLNDYLERLGGHIGYGILARYRRRGHATEILRQSLIVARASGVERVLVTCDEDNVGSATVIETCGGRLESVIAAGQGQQKRRRYWFD